MSWITIKEARKHGYNVKKTDGFYVCGKLNINGYQYNKFGWTTKKRAILEAYNDFKNK